MPANSITGKIILMVYIPVHIRKVTPIETKLFQWSHNLILKVDYCSTIAVLQQYSFNGRSLFPLKLYGCCTALVLEQYTFNTGLCDHWNSTATVQRQWRGFLPEVPSGITTRRVRVQTAYCKLSYRTSLFKLLQTQTLENQCLPSSAMAELHYCSLIDLTRCRPLFLIKAKETKALSIVNFLARPV